jgi:hypothetical protein
VLLENAEKLSVAINVLTLHVQVQAEQVAEGDVYEPLIIQVCACGMWASPLVVVFISFLL